MRRGAEAIDESRGQAERVLTTAGRQPSIWLLGPHLLRRVQAGDRASLDELLVWTADVARRYSRSMCHQGSIEDNVQDVLLKTLRYAGAIRQPDDFDVWIYRTARTACLLRRRRRGAEPRDLLSIDQWGRIDGRTPCRAVDERCTQEKRLIRDGLRTRMGRVLGRLDRHYRAVVLLRDVEGLTTREAARALGLSESNVKIRLFRAHRLLRNALEADGLVPALAPRRLDGGPAAGASS